MKEDDTIFLAGNLKEMLEEHLKLGREKPVSYLPINTVEKVMGMSTSAYIALIEHSGNHYAIFRAEDCCINSGAVYAYSFQELERVLKENRSILSEHGWPVIPVDFIKRIASAWLDHENPIMPIIKKAFGDFVDNDATRKHP